MRPSNNVAWTNGGGRWSEAPQNLGSPFAMSSLTIVGLLAFSKWLALDKFHAQELKLGESTPDGWTSNDL